MDIRIETAMSALGGCSVAFAVAKFAITKAVGDISSLGNKLGEVKETLAEIGVYIEKIKDIEKVVIEQGKQLARFEAGGFRKW